MGIFLAVIVIIVLLFLDYRKRKKYQESEYYAVTKNSYESVHKDKGKYGEYLIYKYLLPLQGDKKFLFNCYLPRENGKTTEIDVILLHNSGIYVFESKNYSGWIFGTESQRTWTQTLPNGRTSRKEHFYNPIMQNIGHIKWIKNYIGDNYPIYSIITFSDRCKLQKIQLTSGLHTVINRRDVLSTVLSKSGHAGNCLNANDIQMIYEKLYPLTQVDDAIKLQHVEDILYKYHAETPRNVDSKGTIAIDSDGTGNNDMNYCPKCGAVLVKRIAKRGEQSGREFYGCSNFPKCRYIKNIEDETNNDQSIY